MYVLRDYQREALDAFLSAVEDGVKRPALVLPTGAGKTVVFAHVAQEMAARGLPSVVVVHRDELVRQAAETLAKVSGERVGVVQGTQDDHDAPFVVASVLTLARERRRKRFSDDARCVIVDECHHATARSYISALTHFGCFDPDSKSVALGVTATMQRGDGVALGKVWERIVFQRDVPWMIRRGYLTDAKGYRLKVEDLDMSRVRKTAGDYNEGDVGEAIVASSSPAKVAEKYDELCRDDDGVIMPGILFAPTVETAGLFADALNARGIRAAVVHGAMEKRDRRRILREYEGGRIDVLCNCMVLTEGFDSPRARVCVIARPTASASLYVQMVGRVLRLYPGKTHALVLDVVGASSLHALSTLATLSGREMKVKDGESLLEAIDADEERVGKPSVYSDDRLVAEEVDLFHGSRLVWQQTAAGWWFIGAGGRYIVIVPSREDASVLDVMWLPKDGKGGSWIARGLPNLPAAKQAAESDVTDDEHMTAMRDRGWRKRPGSSKSQAYAEQLGVKLDALPDRKGGTVADAITYVLASRRIDPTLKRHLGR